MITAHHTVPTLCALVFNLVLAGCGSADGVDTIAVANVTDDLAVDAADDAVASAPTIDAVDVVVTQCPCRCVTDTNTTLTLHGRGFLPEAVVTVDDVNHPAVLADEGTMVVRLWESPEAGEHVVVVHIAAADGVEVESNAVSFVMPDAAPAP